MILLYNGGNNPDLLNHGFPFERYGAVVHPAPQQMKWGWLHGFALDSMKFALDNFLLRYLHRGRLRSDRASKRVIRNIYPGIFRGWITSVCSATLPDRQQSNTRVAPAMQAWREFNLWRTVAAAFPARRTEIGSLVVLAVDCFHA